MNDSRIFRLTVSGGVLISSILLNYIVLGGSFRDFGLEDDKIKNLLAIVLAIISTPALGFMTSTLNLYIMHWTWGYKLHFYFPNDETNRNRFFDDLLRLTRSFSQRNLIIKIRTDLNTRKIPRYYFHIDRNTKEQLRELHEAFVLVIRIHSRPQVTDHVVRRWNIFWTHINSISSIFYGLILAFILRLIIDNQLSIEFSHYNPDITKGLYEVPFLIYIGVSIWHLINVRKSAILFENKYLSEL